MSLSGYKRRIFVAEDDSAIQELLDARLNVAGYAIVQARDGVGAFNGICALKPDAVILDINLPGMDGLEVLRLLKARPDQAHIPVMMMSARREPEDIQAAMKLGARDYLPKPFDTVQLLRRVKRLLRPRSATPEAADEMALI